MKSISYCWLPPLSTPGVKGDDDDDDIDDEECIFPLSLDGAQSEVREDFQVSLRPPAGGLHR